MAGRIEWGRYEGDDVESVIAMMLNREHPDSVRIRPSQGDGGVDVLDRAAGPEGGDVVYQVKRYADPLDADKKAKIKHSLETLLHPTKRDERWTGLNVTQWRLVLPWDATPEADDWFHNILLEDYDVDAVWDGLVLVEQLAAKYDDVIDYYLRDGKSSVIEAMKDAMSLMSLEKLPALEFSAPEIALRVQEALPVLDHDPHYAYEFRFGHGEPSPPPARPRLVMSSFRVDPAAATWHAIDILARCAESTTQRPITIEGVFTVEPGSDFAQALKDFSDFGTPFISPEGAYSGHIDAPGGLDEELLEATVTTLPVDGSHLGDDGELRLEMVDSEGHVVAAVDVDRTERSRGEAGLRVVMTDTADVFDLTMLFNLRDSTTKMEFTFREPTGKPVLVVRPAIDFVANFHHPHSLRTSMRGAPPHLGAAMPLPKTGEHADGPEALKFQAHIVGLLSELQAHADTLIRIPGHADVLKQFRSWELAANVLAGGNPTIKVNEDFAFMAALKENTTFPQGSFVMEVPLEVGVGAQRLSFGTMFGAFDNPAQVGDPIHENSQVIYSFVTADRTVRYSKTSPE